MKSLTTIPKVLTLAVIIPLAAGCAFDVSHLKQAPVTFTAVNRERSSFVLRKDVKATLGTGFPTRLKAGTSWQQSGSTEYGAVYATADQIVTVEASNIYEAQIVVSDQRLVGFYLPVEKKYAPVSRPISLEIQSVKSNQP